MTWNAQLRACITRRLTQKRIFWQRVALAFSTQNALHRLACGKAVAVDTHETIFHHAMSFVLFYHFGAPYIAMPCTISLLLSRCFATRHRDAVQQSTDTAQDEVRPALALAHFGKVHHPISRRYLR